jgi:hypothetical protein
MTAAGSLSCESSRFVDPVTPDKVEEPGWLGQVLPVRVVFVACRDSPEDQAAALVGEKRAAGQTLYGDEVGGAIAPEPEDDFLGEPARAALQGRRINLEAIFAREDKGTTSSPGSPPVVSKVEPTAKSPALPVMRHQPLGEVKPVDPAAYSRGGVVLRDN